MKYACSSVVFHPCEIKQNQMDCKGGNLLFEVRTFIENEILF